MRWFKSLLAWMLVTLLVACGGGGGTSGGGSSLFGGGTTTGDTSGSSSSGSGTSNVTTSSSGSVVMTLSSSSISASTPGTVTALVKDANGQPIANTIVTFAVTSATATVSPARVTTNASGIAATSLQPVTGAVGADYVTASADMGASAALTSRVVFTVSPVSVTLSSIAASPTSVPAYGASVVSVGVTGASASSPVTVTFSSTCANAATPLAILSPTSVTVTGATASTTYQDKGCGGTDGVSAVINGTAQQLQVSLAVAPPAAQSLEFVSATPDTICLAGSGCSASSVVAFRLRDQFSQPVAGRDVSFALDVPNVAELSFASAKTDSSGVAQVSVSAKAVPSPVRVRATVVIDSSTSLTTVSNVLSINAGLPTSRAVSFSAATYNVDGWSKDGTESSIRLQLNDRYGNPVPDGTAINLVAEGSSVIPASCTTTSGVCTVKFVSSNPRPADGRISVIAYAQGEEAFDDLDGDNKYTLGENFDDVGQVFVDRNENNTMEPGEYLVGSAADGIWSSNVYVRAARIFTLSNSSVAPRLGAPNGAGSCAVTGAPAFSQLVFSPATGIASCRVSQSICLRDSNAAADSRGGNPIPANSTLSVATNAKGASVSIDGSPVTAVVTDPTRHQVLVQLADCTKALEAPGTIDLTVTMPDGTKYTMQIGTIQ